MSSIIDQTKHPKSIKNHYTLCDSLMRYAEFLGYGDIHTKIDEKTGLKAIIAIHNLRRGPAIGGCRFLHYTSVDKALEDALRLGSMMSFKAAINNLPHGGAKAVLIKPKEIIDKEAYFEKFGEFINELCGRYIAAVDSGTSPIEMDIIARRTAYVTCTTQSGADSDPSPLTALGVRRGIEAAVKFRLGKDSLAGVRIAVQGAGHVGYYLTKELVACGAEVTVTDINVKALQRMIDEFGVKVCGHDDIYNLETDVFSPCALGAVLNLQTIKRLRTSIVAGSANNQLAHNHYASVLQERGILYAPDFLINAGGLIHVSVIYDHGDIEKSHQQILNIYQTAYEVFEIAALENISPNDVALRIATERLRG